MNISARTSTLLCFSWLLSAALGALLAIHWPMHAAIPPHLTLQSLSIVAQNGEPRITLQTKDDEPILLMRSAAGTTVVRLETPGGLPHLRFSVPSGASAVELGALPGPRGLLSFSSPDRPEGKLMLGHFGTTDDGTDRGMWGLLVSSPTSKRGPITRALGVTTHNGQDGPFLWPVYPKAPEPQPTITP